MNNDVELEGRPRPLSTGLWTLFSWLRRDDRSESSESLSSAGSDRTVASFAFLTPAHYKPAAVPLVLPPPGSPTDSYKRRVHDRNLRRQYDRDITLHRKYGLFKSGEATCGYDAFSLPPARRNTGDSGNRWDRERRATSECFQRRLAHVPGKRRAPLPPVSTITTPTASLTRRSSRKRRAPQPPVKSIERNRQSIQNVEVNTTPTQMNPHSYHETQKIRNDVTMGCKSEKYSKKEGCAKETKVKSEKSFLKQIFDSKKRNSGIDISSVKLLPSISELDKQAAEIIESCKLNAAEQNNNVKNILSGKIDAHGSTQSETWICVSCLKKYNSSIITCPHCVQNQKVNSIERDKDDKSSASKASSSYTQTEKNLSNSLLTNKNAAEEKQKLKEMLKEMKDSLPKRPKHAINNQVKTVIVPESRGNCSYSTETPTLRVGCTPKDDFNIPLESQPSTSNTPLKSLLSDKTSPIQKQSPITIHPAPTVHVMPAELTKKGVNVILETKDVTVKKETDANIVTDILKSKQPNIPYIDSSEQFKNKKDLHTPLKISSLLNPVYVPKNFVSNKPQQATQPEPKIDQLKLGRALLNDSSRTSPNISSTTSNAELPGSSTSQISRLPISTNKVEMKAKTETEKNIASPFTPSANVNVSVVVKKDISAELQQKDNKIAMPSSSTKQQNIVKDANTQDQHSRRRELIHQLEQSIAKGDERAAAAAAAKLAQLRLSCSVLSFSSQILSQPSTSTSNTATDGDKINSNRVSANIPVPEEKLKKVTQGIKLSSLKDKSPQKEVVGNAASKICLVKTNVGPATPNVETQKDNSLQKNDNILNQARNAETALEVKKENLVLNDNMITIAILVEDREATRGPVHLRIRRQALMRDLRREAETFLGVGTNLQRWIVGRVLCADDNTPLISLAGPDFKAPFYLCVVESEAKPKPTSPIQIVETKIEKVDAQPKAGNVYTELVQLEQQALVLNAENFECGVCMEEYTPGRGVILRDCVHIFCKDCLSDVVRHCEEPDIPCPAMGCRGMLQEREIRALVTPQDYERWLARGLAAAESGTRNAFHCRTRDCKGWALCEPGVQRFPCPVCKHINCVPCQAIHDGETCEQHRVKLKEAASGKAANPSETDDGTRTLLNALIAKGEALECPECSAIITKKWGCDWVKCSACKTEICWVTRGRRWGPGGKGDTSGGCRCGVDGKRCHPSCGYCH